MPVDKPGKLIKSVSDLLVSVGDIKKSGFVKLSSHNHHTNWQAITEPGVD